MDTKRVVFSAGGNPCLNCGACCAYFRVSFYWEEADRATGGNVPEELTEQVDAFRCCMRGTNQKNTHCIALLGDVGREVHCSIYENRPSPCRDFGVKWSNSHWICSPEELERCNKARAHWGLPPLEYED